MFGFPIGVAAMPLNSFQLSREPRGLTLGAGKSALCPRRGRQAKDRTKSGHDASAIYDPEDWFPAVHLALVKAYLERALYAKHA